MKNQKGFALIFLISFLPLVLAATFCLYMFFTFSKSDTELAHTCHKEQILILEKVKTSILQLLALNPKAYRLRHKTLRAQERLKIASRTANPIIIAAAVAHLAMILNERRELDAQQKSIIKSANAFINSGQESLKLQLAGRMYGQSSAVRSFAALDVSQLKTKKTVLAVKPDFPDLAPAYQTKNNFSAEQALELSWRIRLGPKGATKKFLPFSQDFRKTCSTTIQLKETSWPIVIREVKSLWKPL